MTNLTIPDSASLRSKNTAGDIFGILAILIAVVAVGAGALGLLFSSQATVGVAIIAGACLFAIVARMMQAAAHTRAILEELRNTQRVLR